LAQAHQGPKVLDWLKRLLGSRSQFNRLVSLVRGDEAAAERLIAFELKRQPGLSRDQATRRAIDRLVHERLR